jgi:hypothetical protein
MNHQQRRQILNQIESAVGPIQYQKMVAVLGEDGLIDACMRQVEASFGDRQSVATPRRFRFRPGDIREAAREATKYTIFLPFIPLVCILAFFGLDVSRLPYGVRLILCIVMFPVVGGTFNGLSGWAVVLGGSAAWLLGFLLYLSFLFCEKR